MSATQYLQRGLPLPKERAFLFSALVILGCSGSAKILSSLGTVPILELPDPVFRLPNRWFLCLAGAFELCAAAYLLLGRNQRLKLLLVAWLSTIFCLYRLEIWLTQPGKPCHCLGTVTEYLHLKADQVEPILVLLIYLLAGSFWFSFLARKPAELACSPVESGTSANALS